MHDGGRLPPAAADAGADASDAAYRGFLFADLRGYTAFVERHGDAAGADLLDAYRALVRTAVSGHSGAEIRTEGDSFYVVFSSARRAVACGLAIVAAAEQHRREQPARPIRVGIGVNAGETVQRGEGYVGTAVNLAARICAQAREGEVLVTAAVRDAVGAGAGLRFAPRGTRRLKGIAHPVPLFAAEPDTAPAQGGVLARLRAIGWLPVAGIAAAAAAVLTLAAMVVLGDGPGTQPSSGLGLSPSSAPSSPFSGPTTSPSSSTDPNAYPTEAESELLARFDVSTDYCERADEDDRPRLVTDPANAQAFGISTREPLSVDAELVCEIPSIQAPDELRLWSTLLIGDVDSIYVPETWIQNRAGFEGVPPGDCSEVGVAHGRWEVGDLGGRLMCREVFGDAVIDWSYDGSRILARAIRRDGDLAALLSWWTAEARFLRP